MTSQMVDVYKEVSNIPTSQIPTNDTKTEDQITSSCSCPQCNSIDCFEIRYEKDNLLCTCPDCKNKFYRKNESNKISGDENNGEVTKKNQKEEKSTSNLVNKKSECNCEVTKKILKEDGQNNLLNTDIKIGLPNKISDDKIYLELTRKTVQEDAQKNAVNASKQKNLKSEKCNDKLYSEITRKFFKENMQKCALNAQTKHDLENNTSDDESYRKITPKVKGDQQKEVLNIQRKSEFVNISFNEHNYHEISKEVVKEDKPNNPLNTECESCHEKTRKVVKEDEQNDSISICTKCNHFNTKNYAGACKITKKSGKSHEQKDTQNKSDFSDKKSDCKSCEKSKKGDKIYEQKDAANTCTTANSPHKKSDNISYRDITKKIIKELEKKDTLNKHIKSKKSEVDICEHTEYSYKDKRFIKDRVQKKERSYEESYTQNYSVAMTCTRKEEKTEFEDPTATLSAQIMDLPYQDYKDSLSSHRPTNSVNTNKITKPDILAKLKEIYKACSCKFCECIPGYSANEALKVENCGCEDIKYLYNTQRDSHNTQHDYIRLPHSGCACYRCDREDCRGVWKSKKETATCDCEPCECVKFSKSFTKPCDCEPCQCAECTPFHILRPVIVAPVQGNFQQNMCQCEPCECIHCTHNYGAVASNLMREASTGMATQRNCNCNTCVNNSCQFDSVDCRCDTQNRIVRKPIERSARDYDLRRALVEENSFSRKRSVKIKNCDTVAMFAFSNNYSNTVFNNYSTDGCHCIDSECIICKDNEKYESRNKNSYEDIPLAFSSLSDKSFSKCKCQICCEAKEAESDRMQVTRGIKNCGCDICDCRYCGGRPYCFQNKEINDHSQSDFNKNVLQSVENSIENFKYFSNEVTTDFFYPLKKGKLLTPSMFEAKIHSHRKFQSQSNLPNVKKPLPSKSILKVSGKESNKKLLCPQNIKICHLKSVKKSSNKNLLTTYLNGSTVDIIENNTIHSDTNAKKCINNIEAPLTSFIFQNKPPAICVDDTNDEIIKQNQSNMEDNNNEVKFLNSIHNSNIHHTSKDKKNSDVDLYCSRVLSFEKSILQIQEDISQSRKKLAEICSKNGISLNNFSEKYPDTSFYDVITSKSLPNKHETNLIDPAEFTENYKKPDLIQNLDSDKIEEIVKNRKIFVDGVDNNFNDFKLKYDQNVNFSKADNKISTRLIKKSNVSVNKIRWNVARSRVKKISKYSENKIIDFISEYVKENYRHHGKNKLNRQCSTRSACTSHENILVAEHKELKLKDKNEHSQTEISSYQDDAKLRSVLRKNLYTSHTSPVIHRGVSTIPELELNIKRTLQSVSLQTNENQGYAALTKLQTEVNKLLNSPMLQLKSYLKFDLNVVAEENVGFRPKVDTKVQEETNIDMRKLVDFLLTRIECKAELTKPFSTTQEIPIVREVPKIDSAKCTCEDLKARFLALRRISDHTVLVRWKTPRRADDVQGYELQVDGRPVRKLLNPTRCMAVLTCLPHCEKLVLTIRTLTFSQLPPDQHPAATIVYWPREKRSRHPR